MKHALDAVSGGRIVEATILVSTMMAAVIVLVADIIVMAGSN